MMSRKSFSTLRKRPCSLGRAPEQRRWKLVLARLVAYLDRRSAPDRRISVESGSRCANIRPERPSAVPRYVLEPLERETVDRSKVEERQLTEVFVVRGIFQRREKTLIITDLGEQVFPIFDDLHLLLLRIDVIRERELCRRSPVLQLFQRFSNGVLSLGTRVQILEATLTHCSSPFFSLYLQLFGSSSDL